MIKPLPPPPPTPAPPTKQPPIGRLIFKGEYLELRLIYDANGTYYG
ncbi:MAG: hypothetical protein ACTSYB_04360 [Candidatus Helarchaeota archaeon]